MAPLCLSLWLLAYLIQLLALVVTYHVFEDKAKLTSGVIVEQASRIAKLKAEVLEMSVREEDAKEAAEKAIEHSSMLQEALRRKERMVDLLAAQIRDLTESDDDSEGDAKEPFVVVRE